MNLDRPTPPEPYNFLPAVPDFTLTSNDIASGERIADAHAHHSAGGGNASPHLSWSGAPAGTRSYAVTCLDPDAPTGSGAWHWLLVNLPATTTELPTGAGGEAKLADGAFHTRNDLGGDGYDGAAPPPGDRPHRYLFAVHALDTDALDVAPDLSPALVGFNLTAHTLARAVLRPVR
ncbi:YbhB/YbcL family Raf kinase inhibitor-like protein [Streptacidiphilus rugosus]|uniref:YbhB/YbcL family Raf kinase inhibitor-like protein n=1 Tax=Streptacidiphilus rugosus TaxID=405783 RepID=UPI0005643EB3|nr:YbhB/YbcL family Raf kinase inhibitor-like protein [Streptacidiphilus rugosus]